MKEDKAISQIAAENLFHPNRIHHWKKQALENFPQLFEDERKSEKMRQAEYGKQMHELCTEIGRLSAQPACLKKTGLSE